MPPEVNEVAGARARAGEDRRDVRRREDSMETQLPPRRLHGWLVLCAAATALAAPPSLAAAPAPAPASAPANADDAQVAALRKGAAAFARLEQEDVAMLSRALDALQADTALVELFRARDREGLLARALPAFEELKRLKHVTHWYFLDPEPARTCFLRVHAPQLHGDVVQRETFSQAIATQRIGYGKELGKTAFALRVVKPIFVGKQVVGYMELGEEIDHFLERMRAETGDDYGVLVDKAHVDRKELARVRGEDRWDERPEVVLVDSTIWTEQIIELGRPLAQIPDGGVLIGTWRVGARQFVGGAFPIRDARGRIAGALFVRHDLSRP